MSKKQQLEGRRFGRLKVIHPAGHKNGRSLWYCECDCGAGVVVRGINLVTGNTESCGCLKSEVNARKVKTHGESRGEGTKEYRAWSSMKQRVTTRSIRGSAIMGAGVLLCAGDGWTATRHFCRTWEGVHPTKTRSTGKTSMVTTNPETFDGLPSRSNRTTGDQER